MGFFRLGVKSGTKAAGHEELVVVGTPALLEAAMVPTVRLGKDARPTPP